MLSPLDLLFITAINFSVGVGYELLKAAPQNDQAHSEQGDILDQKGT